MTRNCATKTSIARSSTATLLRRLRALAAAAWLVGCSGSAAFAADGFAAGTPLPAIAVLNLDGASATTTQWHGKPMVMNVWATWCAPCRTEMPSLQKLSEVLAADGIRVAALSVDRDHNLVREFVLKYGISLPVAIARSPNEAMSDLKAFGLPLTIYVDGNGRVIGQHLGQRDWAGDDVVAELKRKFGVTTRR